MYGYQYGHGWDGMWGGGMFHGVMSLIFLVVVIAVGVAVVRWLWRLGHAGTDGNRGRASSALAELNQRYARGEIDREDYLQRKADLGGTA